MRKLFTTLAIVAMVGLAATAAAQVATGPASPDQIQRALDEAPGPWAEEAIELVVSRGLYIGYPDGSFGWRNNISRAEFAVVLARLINTFGLERFSDDEVTVLRNAADELRAQLGDVTGRLNDQQQQIDELRATTAALESMVMAFEGRDVSTDMQAFNDRLAAIESAVDAVRAELSALPAAPTPEAPTTSTDPATLDDMQARLGAVESDRARLSDELSSLRSEQQALASRVAALEAQAQQPQPQVETPSSEGQVEVVTVPDDSATVRMVNDLRSRVDQLESRLQTAEDGLAAAREQIADHSDRIARLESRLLPDRGAFYVNLGVFGTSPDLDLYGKAIVGHDSLFGAVGARVSFEYSFSGLPSNLAGALTYRTSFGSSDGYFGLGGGVTMGDTMDPFGEILVGMNFRLTRTLGMYIEGNYRPYFDGTTPTTSGFSTGVSVRF